jgi:hypothetical protein
LLVGFLAPFAYEVGVMVPVLILAVEGLGLWRQEFERPNWLPLVYMILIWGLALPIVLLLEPETGSSLRLPSMQNLWRNGAYFLEGLLYPVTPLATPLERLLNASSYRYVLLMAINAIGLFGLLAFYAWVRRMYLFFYALSWFVVGVLPLWLMLDFSYVITSPRILYLGTVGIVLLWAGVPVLLWTGLRPRWGRRLLSVAALLAILVLSVAYVRQRMELAEAIAAPLQQATRATKAEADADSLLFVNVPAWIAPKQPTYRVGTEGLTFIPEYVRVQDFIYVNTGIDRPIEAVAYDPVKEDWQAYIGYAGASVGPAELADKIRLVDAVYLTRYPADDLRFVEAGALQTTADLVDNPAPMASFGDKIQLLEAQIEPGQREWRVTLRWRLQPPGEDVTAFVHLYDGAGTLVAQADGYPLAGLLAPEHWRSGDIVRDVRHIALPEGSAGKAYRVAVGWYQPATAQRMRATDSQGHPVPDDALQIFPP